MRLPLLRDGVRRSCQRSPLSPAVVLGTNVTGLTEARALARHAIPVIGVDEIRRRYTSYSSAWAQVVVDGDFNAPALVELLVQLAGEIGRRPALFISTDEQVKLIAHHGAQLREHYTFDLPSPDVVDLLMSKEAFTSLAAQRGWPIPATITADDRAGLEARLADIRYPVILKPRLKNLAARQHASQKAYRCVDRPALLAAYDDLAPWEPEVVVQEFIPGTDGDVHYSFHYFDAAMREVATFEGRKIRQWIPQVGNTASSEPVHPPLVTAMSREILASVRCPGFCSVEYKRDPRTGTFYITEPTVGRVNLQLGTAIANGVNLVARAYFHLHGLPYPGTEVRTYDRKWVFVRNDMKSARHYIARGELTWGGWARSLRGRRWYPVWRATDTGMWLGAARDMATRIPRALVRRLARRPAPGAGPAGA